MRASRLNFARFTLLGLSMLWLSIASAAPPPKVTVTGAEPNSALQGEALQVVISGSGFGHGATVKYLVGGTNDDSQINVQSVTYNEADDTLITTIQVEEAAVVSEYDIEVQPLSGRRGKGTTLFSVQSSGHGGGSGTAAIPLDCGFADAPGDSFLSDALGAYQDDVDKVLCTTGSSQEPLDPSHVRFYTVGSGNVRNAIRKVDFVFDEGSCTNVAGCAIVPDSVFEAAANIDDMEDGRFAARAYAGEAGLAVPHIQDLPPDDTYEVSMRFALFGMAERWSFQLQGRALPGDFKQGEYCDLSDPNLAIGDDVTLYVWPDGDLDGKPDGYTFTTAADLDTSTLPPTVNIAGTRTATLCSNVGIDGSRCGGPGRSDLCHLISQMEVEFTWHAVTQ